jgi:hypothetical protein
MAWRWLGRATATGGLPMEDATNLTWIIRHSHSSSCGCCPLSKILCKQRLMAVGNSCSERALPAQVELNNKVQEIPYKNHQNMTKGIL